MVIVEDAALVEEGRFRRVQVFRRCVLVERPSAERDDSTRPIADREHHPVAEPVVRNLDVITMHEKADLDHRFDVGVEAGEMVAQRVPFGGRIADAEGRLARGRDTPLGDVSACLCALARREPLLEELRRLLQHLVQAGTLALVLDALDRALRQREPGFACQALDGLKKR